MNRVLLDVSDDLENERALYNEALTEVKRELKSATFGQGSTNKLQAGKIAYEVHTLVGNSFPECDAVNENKSMHARIPWVKKFFTLPEHSPSQSQHCRSAIPPSASRELSTTRGTTSCRRDVFKSMVDGHLIRFSNSSSGLGCIELAKRLVPNTEEIELHFKPWSVSTSKLHVCVPTDGACSKPAENVDVEDPTTVANTVAKVFTHAIRCKLQTLANAGGGDVEASSKDLELMREAEDLAQLASNSCRLDLMQAYYSRELAKATVRYNQRIALVRNLVDQYIRLQHLNTLQQQHVASVRNVGDALSGMHASLETRLKDCRKFAQCLKGQGTAIKPPPANDVLVNDTLKVTSCGTSKTASNGVAHNADIDTICRGLCETLVTQMETVKAVQDDERALRKQVANFSKELLMPCEGSLRTWYRDKMSQVQKLKDTAFERQLVIEFHKHPEKFLGRMRNLQKKHGAC